MNPVDLRGWTVTSDCPACGGPICVRQNVANTPDSAPLVVRNCAPFCPMVIGPAKDGGVTQTVTVHAAAVAKAEEAPAKQPEPPLKIPLAEFSELTVRASQPPVAAEPQSSP